MRLRPSDHLARSPAGAILTLLVLFLLAPLPARAGCLHLATSRDELARLSFLEATLDRDLFEPADAPVSPPDQPSCSGSWCSGAPAIPPASSAEYEGRSGHWAWQACTPDEDAAGPSFLEAPGDLPRPVRRASSVFHPPRLLRST